MPPDPWDLQRFVDAQAPVLPQVVEELSAGRKASHWMWYVFPQLVGLGTSPMATRYGIRGLDEARAYLEHPVLGPRLREHTELVLRVPDRSAHAIFGWPDYLKFCSSMTLFDVVATGAVFARALERFFDREGDPVTREQLGHGAGKV